MKIAFVLPTEYHAIFQRVEYELWPRIQAEYFIYDDYKKAPEFVQNRQSEFDGVIFAGKAPYLYTLERIKPEVLWGFLPGNSSSFMRALLTAATRGWNIASLSIDCYEKTLIEETYKNIGLGPAEVCTQSYLGDAREESHNTNAVAYHVKNWKSGRYSGCITRLKTVAEALKSQNIPVILAGPTYENVREQIDFLIRIFSAKMSVKTECMTYTILIDLPADYSPIASYEHKFVKERVRLAEEIYRYAERIGAAVVEISSREYLIFSTHSGDSADLSKRPRLELLDILASSTLFAVKIGVGSGENLNSSHDRAGKALLHIKQMQGSAGCCLGAEGNEIIIRPGVRLRCTETEDAQLLHIANQSGISLETVSTIYSFASEHSGGVFTIRDLADYLEINVRSAGRIVERLEQHNFLICTGQINSRNQGRPRRLYRFKTE